MVAGQRDTEAGGDRMGLETASTIAGLNASWPLGTDSTAQGDDHLRLIKSVLQADALSKDADLELSAVAAVSPNAPSLFRLGELLISWGSTGTTPPSSVTTTFPAAYAARPAVLLTPIQAGLVPRVVTASETEFTATFSVTTAPPGTGGFFFWLAIGQAA